MGLSRRELRNAIGIVGVSTVSLGISRCGEVSMWKGIATAYATHSGIQACQMARVGVTGPEAVFEGPAGFFEIVADRELTVDRLEGRDGDDYRIIDAHLKPFPCGYYLQPMIAGVQALVESHDIDSDAVGESEDLTVFVEENPDATPTIVEIVADGQRHKTRLNHASGHARNPLSRERLETKISEHTAGLFSDDQTDLLVDLCDDLETLNRVDLIVDATIV